MPVGAKLSLADIVRKVHEEKIYENMSDEELDKLIERLEGRRASKAEGKRVTPNQKISDAAQTLNNIHRQVCNFISYICTIIDNHSWHPYTNVWE